MLIMTSVLRVGQSPFASVLIDEDSVERITTCLNALSNLHTQIEPPVKQIFLHDTQAAYAGMVAHSEKREAEKKLKNSKLNAIQADDLISIRHLAKKGGGDADEYDLDLSKATGMADLGKDDFLSKLSRVVQLTGIFTFLSELTLDLP